MPLLVQISIVIATLAFVAIVTTTIIALVRLGQAAGRLSTAAESSLAQVEAIVLETKELLAAMREIMPPAQRVMKRFERLGDRVAAISTAVLDEVEEPVLATVAMARGLRAGSTSLLDSLTRRFVRRSSSNNGDQDHE